MKQFTLAYITGRKDPHLAWFVDSLARQVPVEERHLIHLVFVDRHLWAISAEAGSAYWKRGDLISLLDPTWQVESRREMFANAVRGRFDFQHLPVKPAVFQGPFRFTSRDLFAAGVARNTAIIAARHDYMLFVDDLSVLLPGWWSNAKYAAENNLCCAGMYRKQLKLVVEDGEIKSYEDNPTGRDSRWAHGSDGGIVKWSGAGLFGCSFGMPVEILLHINGHEELSSEGGEDFCLGIRSERAGAHWWLNKNLGTVESEEGHHIEPSLPRGRKIVTTENLPPGYDQYPHARDDEKYYSDHVMLNRLRHEPRITTIAQFTDLRKAREEFMASGRALIPTEPQRDWRDGSDLRLL